MIEGGCSSAIESSVELDWFVAGAVLAIRWTTRGGNGGGTSKTGGPPAVFVLDVTFGFKGVIDCPDVVTEPGVSVFPLELLPVLPGRAPIPRRAAATPSKNLARGMEPSLKEHW